MLLNHEKLDVYQASIEFAVIASGLVKQIPSGYALFYALQNFLTDYDYAHIHENSRLRFSLSTHYPEKPNKKP